MPQFDTTYLESQVFWTIVSFFILFYLLNRWVLPPIQTMLKQRAAMIESDFKMAALSREEAEAFKREYAAKLEKAQIEVDKVMAEAKVEISQRHEQAMRDIEARIQRKKDMFIMDQQQLLKQNLQEMKIKSAELILLAAEQLVHHHFSDADAQHELEDIVNQLESKPIDRK